MTIIEPIAWVRAVHFATTIVAAGCACFLAIIADFVVPSAAEKLAKLRRSIVVLAIVMTAIAVLSAAVWLILQSATMSGLPLSEAWAEGAPWMVVRQTRFGSIVALRTLIAALLVFSLAFWGRKGGGFFRSAIGVVLGATFLGSLAFIGHAGAGAHEFTEVHTAADVVHLLAAGAWLGGLVPLALLLATGWREGGAGWDAAARCATARFSWLGMVSVAALLATGIVNAWFLAGTIDALVNTTYGKLLTVKIVLFGAMICVAAFNRFRLTPSLPEATATIRLRRNCYIELAVGLVVILIVGVLGTLAPPVHGTMHMDMDMQH